MKENIVRALDAAARSLKAMRAKGLHNYDEVIADVDRTLELLKDDDVAVSMRPGRKIRFVSKDTLSNLRYLTVADGHVSLLSGSGQRYSLSDIASNQTQELLFALEDAPTEEDMLKALKHYTKYDWKVYAPDRT